MIHLARHRRAAAGMQYAMLLGLVGIVALLGIGTVGQNVDIMMKNVSNRLGGAGNAVGGGGGGGSGGPSCLSDGVLDTTFLGGGAGANNSVNVITPQPDDKLLIGGVFSSYNGASRTNIARANADGTTDTGFLNGMSAANSYVFDIAVQPDGKAVVGGDFTTFNGQARSKLVRLNTDGSIDSSFVMSPGPDNDVNTLVLQPDGKILIGGGFAYYNGTLRYGMARINTDGSLDTTFMAGSHNGMSGTGALQDIERLSDGKIIIGGDFTQWDGATRNRIARMNADGSNDSSFQNGLAGANGTVNKVLPLSDGRLYIAGNFSTVNGTARTRIARLNADGTLDTGFASGSGANNIIYNMHRQSDDKIVITGTFTLYRGNARNGIARVMTDGSNDGGFLSSGSGASGVSVYAVNAQSDGRVVLGGGFTSFNGTTTGRIARLGCP